MKFWVGVRVASRRVAQRGSSRTEFREGKGCGPGDPGHTDVVHNLLYQHNVPLVTVITSRRVTDVPVGYGTVREELMDEEVERDGSGGRTGPGRAR
ncbi:hypothetical protein Pme01_05810 [Planosporangium mesophilum]|uniref:Uncharacterized protein n=1 Tax=Planosporangium mesophilum TaxID=689768 RepID=A0A8J3T9X9_9ACTN|nr:hypothetical protein Pme01_05810 [Planosporangium mesophilum]